MLSSSFSIRSTHTTNQLLCWLVTTVWYDPSFGVDTFFPSYTLKRKKVLFFVVVPTCYWWRAGFQQLQYSSSLYSQFFIFSFHSVPSSDNVCEDRYLRYGNFSIDSIESNRIESSKNQKSVLRSCYITSNHITALSNSTFTDNTAFNRSSPRRSLRSGPPVRVSSPGTYRPARPCRVRRRP
jgi:hypothetical protein